MDTKTRVDPGAHAVGAALAHESAHLHVAGRARYIDDYPEPAGCLHVAPGFAQVTRARIESIDLSDVVNSDGVVAVLTCDDIPGNNDCSPAAGDDPILAADTIEFHSQVVFAVVARSRLAARRAARLARITTTPLPAIVDIDDALAADSDLLPPYAFTNADPDEAIGAAATTLTQTFRIGGQDHFYLEGQVALALPGDDADMLVHCSTQHPSEVQHLVANMLGRDDARVVCECRRMGGAFGGKESQAAQWACIAALAAFKTGKPAKLRLDRDDDMMMTGKRHDMRVDYRCGANADGVLQAVDAHFASRCGYSEDLSLGVNDRCLFHADNAYFYPQFRLRSRRLRTNTVSNTAFRGFGGPQGVLFAEHMMQAISIVTGRDALDVRLENLYAENREQTPYGMRVDPEHNPTRLLMRQLERSAGYRERRRQVSAFNSEQQFLRKGLALTPVKFGIAFTLKHLNQTGALVHVYADGSVEVNHGGTEMGQGLNTKVRQVAASVFGIDLDKVRVAATRTDKVPNTTPTAASSGSDLNCMATLRAAGRIRERLAGVFAEINALPIADVEFASGNVLGNDKSMAFGELCKQAFLRRVGLSEVDHYATPKITWDRNKQSGRPFLYFAYGAAQAEVVVDVTTGEMRLTAVDILHDVGRSLNPAIDIGQIEGAFVQGMGWLTSEELVIDPSGRVTTHAPSTYKIPTATDLPEHFNVELYDSPGCEEDTVFRSKAVGEPPLMLAVSVYAAIMDAVASLKAGWVPPLDAPATPESIVRAVAAANGVKA